MMRCKARQGRKSTKEEKDARKRISKTPQKHIQPNRNRTPTNLFSCSKYCLYFSAAQERNFQAELHTLQTACMSTEHIRTEACLAIHSQHRGWGHKSPALSDWISQRQSFSGSPEILLSTLLHSRPTQYSTAGHVALAGRIALPSKWLAFALVPLPDVIEAVTSLSLKNHRTVGLIRWFGFGFWVLGMGMAVCFALLCVASALDYMIDVCTLSKVVTSTYAQHLSVQVTKR